MSSSSGFTLVEVLVAMTLMLTGTVFAMSMIDRANGVTRANKAREAATSVARELTESARAIQYETLSSTTLLTQLAAQPGLEDTVPGGQYTLTRRDVTFVITGAVCVVDDPRDGGGNQSAGGFCTGSAAPMTAPVDKNPQDYKRAAITVTWASPSGIRSVTQSAILNNPGAADAPSVRSISPVNTSTTVSSSSVTSVSLQFVTSKPAASLNWTVDGDRRSPAALPNAAGDVWTASWDISKLPDGTYAIGGEAFDSTGTSGSSLQVNLLLNRYAPTAPKSFSGGRDRLGGVELEWAANIERDIVGYEVRRGTTVVCPLHATGLQTECRDPSPPAPVLPKGTVGYTVYAYDRDVTGQLRESPGTSVTVIDYNTAPDMPSQFGPGTGGVTLQWNRAADSGPSGDEVAYYRVYRDGTAYANRYARWYDNAVSGVVTWTDPKPDGMSHVYRVVAVDLNHMESTFAGPVTVG